jgi:tRNA pseudouridine55 synthase
MRIPPIDGMLLVDKPAGPTSHDVVAVVRRALGVRRVGHAGTLDPFATGLLVLLVGRATRLLPYMDAEPKEYEATIRFGAATDTDDRTGSVIAEAALPERESVERAMTALTGKLLQMPPAYSA